jgi:hypothetical protein
MNKYKAAQYMSASMVACSHAPRRLGVIFKLSAFNANGFEGKSTIANSQTRGKIVRPGAHSLVLILTLC